MTHECHLIASINLDIYVGIWMIQKVSRLFKMGSEVFGPHVQRTSTALGRLDSWCASSIKDLEAKYHMMLRKRRKTKKKKQAFRYQNHIIRTNVKLKSVCPNRLPLKRHGQAIRVNSNDNLFGSIVTEPWFVQQQSGIDAHEALIVLRKFLPGWWFHPSWKICSSNWKFIPHRGENKKYLKPPPPSYIAVEDALFSNAHPPLTRKPGKQHHRRRGPFHLSSYRSAIVWSTKMIQNGERVGC